MNTPKDFEVRGVHFLAENIKDLFDMLLIYKAKWFIKITEKAESIREFDIDLFFRIIEKINAFEGEKIIVSLINGSESEALAF